MAKDPVAEFAAAGRSQLSVMSAITSGVRANGSRDGAAGQEYRHPPHARMMTIERMGTSPGRIVVAERRDVCDAL
jgi:hypothetical protein